jgi:hypothetical protein
LPGVRIQAITREFILNWLETPSFIFTRKRVAFFVVELASDTVVSCLAFTTELGDFVHANSAI